MEWVSQSKMIKCSTPNLCTGASFYFFTDGCLGWIWLNQKVDYPMVGTSPPWFRLGWLLTCFVLGPSAIVLRCSDSWSCPNVAFVSPFNTVVSGESDVCLFYRHFKTRIWSSRWLSRIVRFRNDLRVVCSPCACCLLYRVSIGISWLTPPVIFVRP